MAFGSYDYREVPLYFAYRRKSVNGEHKETFHSHLGIEILFIHQGKGTMIVNHSSYDIKPGMLCIFQPYQLHHLKLEYADDQCFERSIAIFEPTMFETFLEKWPALHAFYRFVYQGKLPFLCLYDADEYQLLDGLFRSMNERLPSLSETGKYEEISLFLVALYRSVKQIWDKREGKHAGYPTPRLNRQAERMFEWIEANYAKPFRLDDMAKSLHLSPYHLSHAFKEATGVSLSAYIATRRVHQSVLLLTTTKKPVSLIAEEIGLLNSSYFCQLFKSRMGITPHQYRKRWAAN